MAKESHDQRRKKKLAEERRKARQNQSLAYLGERYKTDELIPTFMHTEVGIYQTFILLDRKLLDQTVARQGERKRSRGGRHGHRFIKEAEHRPLMAERHPTWVQHVVFWHVHDIDFATPDVALPQIEEQVLALIAGLASSNR